MSRTGLESAASHGIPPPGTDPLFKRNHRGRAETTDARRFPDLRRAEIWRGRDRYLSSPLAELVHGVARANTPQIRAARRAFIDELKKHVPVHPVTDTTAEIAGQISGEQAAKGITLPADDLLIGSSAIEQGYAVATLNIRHFQKIPGLHVLSF